MDDFKEILDLLDQRQKTCILLNNGAIVYESDALGVKPLRQLRAMNYRKFPGDSLTLIDRVIGKGALMLAELLEIDAIYTPLISQTALDYNQKLKLPLYYEKVVPYIQNRTMDDLCPIEKSVLNITDPKEAESAIETAIAILMAQR